MTITERIRSMRRRLPRECPAPAGIGAATALLVGTFVLGLAPSTAHAAAAKPCDIYKTAGTACVAAHSTTRALYKSYDGPLYSVQRASDNTSKDIPLLAKGGYADASVQDRFCKDTVCTITKIYDQSPEHNDLVIEGAGENGKADVGAPASALPIMAGGHPVYGLSISPGMGYRNDHTTGVAVNGQPEGMYMVASGTHHDAYLADLTPDNVSQAHCCFDYGNGEANNSDNGAGHLDAVNIGGQCWFGGCFGEGPWVQADLEQGVFQSSFGGGTDPSYKGSKQPFVTALLKNDGQTSFVLKAGDAQGGKLRTTYSGPLPTGAVTLFGLGGNYTPMHQEGAILLGTGGDDSNNSEGSFFEGVMTKGYPTDAADDAVQAEVVTVDYGSPTGIAGVLKSGSEISLQSNSPCCESFFVTHGTFDNQSITIAAVTAASKPLALGNATWIVRPGFADPKCVSFESRNFPGDFLTVQAAQTTTYPGGTVISTPGQQLQRIPYDGSAAVAAGATFCPQKGLDGKGRSFAVYGSTDKFIRTFNRFLYAGQQGGTNPWDSSVGFADDASFTVTGPLSY